MRVLLLALLAAISYAQTAIDWKIGMDSNTITANVGDTLTFTWSGTGTHDVYKMASSDALASCDFTGAELVTGCDRAATGNCEFTVTELPVYFACQVGGHCGAGQKLTAGACPTACSTAINAIECPLTAESDLSSLTDCASFESMTSCMDEYSTKTSECSDASGGDCAEACTNAINAMDCATVTEGEYPDACTVTTGCANTLSAKVTECAPPVNSECPSSCVSAISGASCTDYSATALGNLVGCEATDAIPCVSQVTAKTAECTSNSESNCPSACASAISSVDCNSGLSLTNLPSDCGLMDAVACGSEVTAKLADCTGDSNDSGASGLSVVFAFVAFAFSQF